MALTFIDPDYGDTLTVVPSAVYGARIITRNGINKSASNHVIDLSLSDVERLRDALTARLESANANT